MLGNVSLDPGCRDRGRSDNPRFNVKNNSKDIQRGRRRQERVGVAGGGTGECCGPVVIGWRGIGYRRKDHTNVSDNENQVRVSMFDFNSSAKVPNIDGIIWRRREVPARLKKRCVMIMRSRCASLRCPAQLATPRTCLNPTACGANTGTNPVPTKTRGKKNTTPVHTHT